MAMCKNGLATSLRAIIYFVFMRFLGRTPRLPLAV